jgi:Fe-S-cluster containining protein
MNIQFSCLRCGRCCKVAGEVLHITQNDVDRWEREGRKDILEKLFLVRMSCSNCNIEWPPHVGENCPECGKVSKSGVYYWLDPRMPKNWLAQLMGSPKCPFLKKIWNKDEYLCGINETKPEICREFPVLDSKEKTKNEAECISWGCEGYFRWKAKARKQH